MDSGVGEEEGDVDTTLHNKEHKEGNEHLQVQYLLQEQMVEHVMSFVSTVIVGDIILIIVQNAMMGQTRQIIDKGLD